MIRFNNNCSVSFVSLLNENNPSPSLIGSIGLTITISSSSVISSSVNVSIKGFDSEIGLDSERVMAEGFVSSV